jgi:hypothetical protein
MIRDERNGRENADFESPTLPPWSPPVNVQVNGLWAFFK